MFGKRTKKKLGFQAKKRTVEEVNREYCQHATQAGHKARLLQEINESAAQLEFEIQDHLTAMRKANVESKSLPPPVAPGSVPPAEEPKPASEAPND